MNKNMNLGIQLLRMILCFWVISFHSLQKNKVNYSILNIIKTKLYHVPCFVFISFYYTFNVFFNKNIKKFQNRLERLLIPYILWPLLILLIDFITNKRAFNYHILIVQLLLGTQFMIPHWYLFSLIFLSILFFIISYLFNNKFLSILHYLAILSYIVQYSGYYRFLNNYKNNVRYPLLHTLGIFPISIIGLTFASLKGIDFFLKNQKKGLFLSSILIYFLFKYNIFIEIIGYNGISHIFASLSFFVFFYLFPLNNINYIIKLIIVKITNYTNGIYCLQSKMIGIVNNKFNLHGNFRSVIII